MYKYNREELGIIKNELALLELKDIQTMLSIVNMPGEDSNDTRTIADLL